MIKPWLSSYFLTQQKIENLCFVAMGQIKKKVMAVCLCHVKATVPDLLYSQFFSFCSKRVVGRMGYSEIQSPVHGQRYRNVRVS